MDGKSLDITQNQINKLKEFFPEVIAEGKIDWEKLRASLGDENIEFANERYVLNWAGKTDAFKSLQQTTTATLKPVAGESINFDATQNVFIEGENLEVLKVLQKAYYEKAKCIIIDPPYNTGSDSFIYPDKFKESREEYEQRVGDKDEEGLLMKEGFFRKNSKDSGRFHSNWLSMMYPRLFLARNLLKDDGVIFVHIDDNEVHNLRLMMNEIFGEENFVDCIIWKKRYGGGAKEKYLVSLHEYVLFYAKNKSELPELFIPYTEEDIERYYKLKDSKFKVRGPYRTHPLEATKSMDDRKNLIYSIQHPDGTEIWPKRQWLWSKDRALRALKNDELEFLKDKNGNWSIHTKQYLRNEKGIERSTKAFSIIDDVFTQHGTNEFISLFNNAKIFSFPKPSSYLKYFLNVGSEKDSSDIVLDFFAGSGTTAQAVLELNKEDGGNRKFILVQLPEKCDEESEAYKAGYKTIADISKERIRRVIKKIKDEKEAKPDMFDNTELDLGFKSFRLSASNFKIWRGDSINEDNIVEQLNTFTDPVREGSEKENMLFELMLKAGYELTDSIEEIDSFYSINNGELIIALDKMNAKIVEKIISLKPKKVITLDNLFKGNDQLKTNTVLQMRDAGVEFKGV